MAYYQQQHQFQQGFQQPPQGQNPQYYQQYNNYSQQSNCYGSYGGFFQQNVFQQNAWQAFQFSSEQDLWNVFYTEMHKNPANAARNAVQAEDLCNILNNCQTIKNYFKIHWSRELCSVMLAMLDENVTLQLPGFYNIMGFVMIAMLDRSKDGFMQWEEFLELQKCLIAWHRVFCQYDMDRSGYIEANELVGVIKNLFGYQVTPQCVETLLKRYSRVIPFRGGPERPMIAFDDFVALAVKIRAFTDAFRRRDQVQHGGETGSCSFPYDDFLQVVMCL